MINTALFVTEEGTMLFWGDAPAFQAPLPPRAPKPFTLPSANPDEPPPRLAYLSAGSDHFVGLTYDSQLFTWGERRMTPELVCHPVEGKKWKKAYSGGGHNYIFAIAEDDELFGWGRNDRGQLGLGQASDPVEKPTKVSSFPRNSSPPSPLLSFHFSIPLLSILRQLGPFSPLSHQRDGMRLPARAGTY
jgi:hypothetical protein